MDSVNAAPDFSSGPRQGTRQGTCLAGTTGELFSQRALVSPSPLPFTSTITRCKSGGKTSETKEE